MANEEAATARRSSRVSRMPERLITSGLKYQNKYLLFFIRNTRSYHNFARSSSALAKISMETSFAFGMDYPLCLHDGIYSGMFIAAEACSQIIRIEKELEKYIAENKENAYLTDGIEAHMKKFFESASTSSSDDDGDVDDSDQDEPWVPPEDFPGDQLEPLTRTDATMMGALGGSSPVASATLVSSRPGTGSSTLVASRPGSSPVVSGRPGGSPLVSSRPSTGSSIPVASGSGISTLVSGRRRAGSSTAGIAKQRKLTQTSHQPGHQMDQQQDREQAVALIAAEQRRALPADLLNESSELTDGTGAHGSEFLTREEFHATIDNLKRFIAHKLRKTRTVSSVHQPIVSDFMNEEFTGHNGQVHTLMDFPRSTTSKFIRGFACAKYGLEYVQGHVFGEYVGSSSRPMAPKEIIDELRRVLNKVFNLSRDQAAGAWTAVKDSLNRMGPEATFRNRKHQDDNR